MSQVVVSEAQTYISTALSVSIATDVIVAGSTTHKDLCRGLARIHTLALKQRAARINALSSMRGPS